MTANTVGIWSCSFATVQLTRYIRSSSQFPSTTLITRPLSGLVSCTKIIIMCALCVLPYLLINLHWVTCTTARRAVTHTHTRRKRAFGWSTMANDHDFAIICFVSLLSRAHLNPWSPSYIMTERPAHTIKSNRSMTSCMIQSYIKSYAYQLLLYIRWIQSHRLTFSKVCWAPSCYRNII